MRQGLVLEPLLQAISDFLDDHEELVTRMRSDLRRGLKQPDTGRNGMAPQEVLRSLILMRVKNWDYRELRERIADGYTLRLFTGFRSRRVPKHTAFHRAFVRLTPATLTAINDLVVKAAVALGLEDGRKLRVDTTVVQTDIHHPTDNTLLWDAVRVLSRLLSCLGRLLGRRVKGFRNRTRAARRRMQAIQRMSTTQRLRQQTAKYRDLLGIAEEIVACARAALEEPSNARCKSLFGDLAVAGLREEIAHYCGLADRVIDQTRRRVIDGEQVPNAYTRDEESRGLMMGPSLCSTRDDLPSSRPAAELRRAQGRSRLAVGHRREAARSGLDGPEHGARLRPVGEDVAGADIASVGRWALGALLVVSTVITLYAVRLHAGRYPNSSCTLKDWPRSG